MSNTPNHVCKVCETAYYACEGCDQRNSWRAVACSPECFKKWVKIIEERDNPKPIKVEVEQSVEIIEEEIIDEIVEKPVRVSTKKSK